MYGKLDSITPSDIIQLIEHVGTTVGVAFLSLNLLADLIKKWLEVYKKRIQIKVGEFEYEYEGGMSQEEVRRVTREIIGILRNNSDIKLLSRAENDDTEDADRQENK